MAHAVLVENAVRNFYSTGDSEIHTWLLQVQASKEAWVFVWQLLDSSMSGEVQFFAANVLHTKISKQWEEVPKSDYLDLRSRLYSVLKQPGFSKIVLTRLCHALAAFLVNCSLSETDERNKYMVEELVELLPYNLPDTVSLFLKVLEAIPKEVNLSDKSHYATEYNIFGTLNYTQFSDIPSDAESNQLTNRGKKRESMILNWRKSVYFLEQIFESCSKEVTSNNEALFLLAIECTTSWLRIGQLPLDTIEKIYPFLLLAAGHFIPRKNNSENGSSEIQKVQDCLTMVLTHSELYKFPQLLWHWGKTLICMVEQSGVQHYYEILTVFGEAHSRNILISLVNNDPNGEEDKLTSQRLIEFLLQCSEQEGRYPVEEKQSCIPFGFWYALQDDTSTLDNPYENEALIVLKPVYARLARALLKKSTVPTSPSEAGDSEERELFRCYRQDVADTFFYCYHVLKDDLLLIIREKLDQSLHDVSKWPDVESAIHGFKALSDIHHEHGGCHEHLEEIINILLWNTPYKMYPPEVLSSLCSMIGDFAYWIAEYPKHLDRALQVIMDGLTNGSMTATAASMALKDVCREGDENLEPLAPDLLEKISRTLTTVTPGSGECVRLMFAACKLMSSLPAETDQLKYLDATIGRCLVRVKELLQLPIKEAQQSIINELKIFVTFFSTLHGPICDRVFEEVLPIFEGLVQHSEWCRDEKTMTSVFKCLQNAMPSLENPKQEIHRLIELLRESYTKFPTPASLDFFKILFTMFARQIDHVIMPVFIEISTSTLRGLAANQANGGSLSDFGDLLDSYLGVLANICRRHSRVLLQIPEHVPEMLRLGMSCLRLHEIQTSKAAGTFMAQAIFLSPHLKTFIQPIGQELSCIIIQCIADHIKFRNLEPVAEVLLAMIRACNAEQITLWFNFALKDYPLSDKDKVEFFFKPVLRERISKLRLRDKLQQFGILFQEKIKCARISNDNIVDLRMSSDLAQNMTVMNLT